jgi:uncharacterized protein
VAVNELFRRLAVVGFVAGIALAGAPHTESPAHVRTAAAVQPVVAEQVPQAPTPEEISDDTTVAVQAVNDFWARHWSEFFTGRYRPPKVWGTYSSATGEGPTCGGRRPAPGNAFYCATGEDFLAWDAQLMEKGSQYGDAWVYLVVAHEWGHAIQYRLDRSLASPAAELQADCFAGAALYGAARDRTLVFEQGDEKEITAALSALADETPWTSRGDHGDALQRVQAFGEGRSGGVAACLPSS